MSREQITMVPSGPIHATVRPPGSKSITNRALVCATLAEGQSVLSGVLESEDTQVMIESLQRLGLQLTWDRAACRVTLQGCGGLLAPLDISSQTEIYVANSGTTMRFLTAMLAAVGQNRFRLDGVARMRERPIQDLADALNALGAHVCCENADRCPPVLLDPKQLEGGQATIRGDISSQFLSGLLMAAPCARQPVTLRVQGTLVSQPYVTMTLQVMESFGVTVPTDQLARFQINAPQVYLGCDYAVEPDASAASYFWAAAAITGGQVTVDGLGPDSLQGDVRFCDCLRQMGCEVIAKQNQISVIGRPLHGITVDMNDISDTAQTLSAVALFADGPTTIHGVAHNRHKETDRIADLARELRKLGARVDELPDGLHIEPAPLHGATLETYQDHRMAMSLALVGLKVSGVVINDPQCTQKTYPRYFEDLERVRLKAGG